MAVAKSGTLVASTVKTETVEVEAFGVGRGVSVTNRSDTGEIWVRLDGVNPTVAGDDCKLVIGTRNFNVPNGETSIEVRMISSSTPNYTVEGKD